MAVSKYTLWSALAFVRITGRKRGLHINTRLALLDYLVPYSEHKDVFKEYLTLEGQELSEKSRLWKAHQALVALGFRLDTGRTKQTPRFVHYVHEDDYQRTAYCCSTGTAYAQEERTGQPGQWKHHLVCEAVNG